MRHWHTADSTCLKLSQNGRGTCSRGLQATCRSALCQPFRSSVVMCFRLNAVCTACHKQYHTTPTRLPAHAPTDFYLVMVRELDPCHFNWLMSRPRYYCSLIVKHACRWTGPSMIVCSACSTCTWNQRKSTGGRPLVVHRHLKNTKELSGGTGTLGAVFGCLFCGPPPQRSGIVESSSSMDVDIRLMADTCAHARHISVCPAHRAI